MTFYSEPFAILHTGDALEVLAGMEAENVHCVVTSPPYWGLRKYDSDHERRSMNIGDKVTVEVNGKEYQGPIDYIQAHEGYQPLFLVALEGGGKEWFLHWQLTKVEEPKGEWLLTADHLKEICPRPLVGNWEGATQEGACAELRHVAEELQRRNKISEFLQPSIPALFLYPDDWAELQKEAGL